jgi:anthranilate phosphoribosyltransferase
VVSGKEEDLASAIEMASDAIDSGKAIRKLDEIRRVSNSL